MKCPRDKTELTPTGDSQHQVLFCSTCHGMWIERSYFHDLLKEDRSHFPSAAITPPPPVAGNRHPPISCPVDHSEIMQQKIYDGIQVDICVKHQAFWLDGGEYDKLVAIYKAKQHSDSKGTPAASGLIDFGVELALDVALTEPDVAEAILEFIVDVLADVF